MGKLKELEKEVLNICNNTDEYWSKENSNKDTKIISTQHDNVAGATSKLIAKRKLIPKDVLFWHNLGAIHFHDMDYFVFHSHNCCLVNLDDMLQNGTVISGVKITKPKLFSTACNIASQIIAQVASCSYGGQTISIAHLSKFVNSSREYYRDKFGVSGRELYNMVYDDIKRGVQTLQYQILTLNTSNGQTPFVTVYLDHKEAESGKQWLYDTDEVIREIFRQRIEGIPNNDGVLITPAFPKLVYNINSLNCEEGTEFYETTVSACMCSATRMNPDYTSELRLNELKEGQHIPPMGCRSFLQPYKDADGNYKVYGRFNQGVVTLNLPFLALCSRKNQKKFWKYLDTMLTIVHKALLCRHKHLEGTKAEVAPILWQYGALARLNPEDTIDELLHGGYSTASVGFCGLWETVLYLTGHKLTDEYGHKFAKRILMYIEDTIEAWRKEDDIFYSIYGTPMESTTYRFAKANQKWFGKIKDVSDHDYITNSYHVNVREPIDAFTKLDIEASLQDLTTGGAISYVELPHMENNIPAVETLVKYIYSTVLYGELNIKSDYCMECGSTADIECIEKADGTYEWKCPVCGNTDQSKMDVTRRTCGYLGKNFWNHGRTAEIHDRVLHL